jgi:hypothetical protein
VDLQDGIEVLRICRIVHKGAMQKGAVGGLGSAALSTHTCAHGAAWWQHMTCSACCLLLLSREPQWAVRICVEAL